MGAKEIRLMNCQYVWCDELRKIIVIETYNEGTPRAKILHKGIRGYLLSLGDFKNVPLDDERFKK